MLLLFPFKKQFGSHTLLQLSLKDDLIHSCHSLTYTFFFLAEHKLQRLNMLLHFTQFSSEWRELQLQSRANVSLDATHLYTVLKFCPTCSTVILPPVYKLIYHTMYLLISSSVLLKPNSCWNHTLDIPTSATTDNGLM
jgi:hypothetical protein